MPSASAPAADPDRTPSPAQRIGVLGRALGRAVVRGAGPAVKRSADRLPRILGSGSHTDGHVPAEKSAASIRRVVLRSGPMLSLMLDWPVDESDPRHAGDHVTVTFRPVGRLGSGTVLPTPIVLSPWSSPSEDGPDEPAPGTPRHRRQTLWTGSGPILALSGRWTLVVQCGLTATDVLFGGPERPAGEVGPIHNRVGAENDQLIVIEQGAAGEAVLRVETPEPAVTVRRVRTRRTPPEVEATVPTGWLAAGVRFELRQRGGGAIVACASHPETTSPDSAAGPGSHHRVPIDPDVLLSAGRPDSASTTWDLWARSEAIQLRVGRRDTDLSSLRSAHSFGWTSADAARAELRPYFTDSADFAVEIRPARERSETTPDVAGAPDPDPDADLDLARPSDAA